MMKTDKAPTPIKQALVEIAQRVLANPLPYMTERSKADLARVASGEELFFGSLNVECRVAFGMGADLSVRTGAPEMRGKEIRFPLQIDVGWPTSRYDVAGALACVTLHRTVAEYAALLDAHISDTYKYGVSVGDADG